MFHQCKVLTQPPGKELPEIEKCFPYNPSGKPVCCFMALELKTLGVRQLLMILSCVKCVEFETYSVPDEVFLSGFSLAGLAKQTWPAASPAVEELIMDPCLPLSPLKMPSGNEYIF